LKRPSAIPSIVPSQNPTKQPLIAPTTSPTTQPRSFPSIVPLSHPSIQPTLQPSRQPSSNPTQPTSIPSCQPLKNPSSNPSLQPTKQPISQPSSVPTIFRHSVRFQDQVGFHRSNLQPHLVCNLLLFQRIFPRISQKALLLVGHPINLRSNLRKTLLFSHILILQHNRHPCRQVCRLFDRRQASHPAHQMQSRRSSQLRTIHLFLVQQVNQFDRP
jgi:hypothetical protein